MTITSARIQELAWQAENLGSRLEDLERAVRRCIREGLEVAARESEWPEIFQGKTREQRIRAIRIEGE